MLKLKEILNITDILTLCEIVDVNKKVILSSIVYDILKSHSRYIDSHILHLYIKDNKLIIILDMDTCNYSSLL